jgi:hypothetical protein
MEDLSRAEFKMISRAVVLWYRYYDVHPVVRYSTTLCREAIALCDEGMTTPEEIAATLIKKYVADERLYRGSSGDTRH